MQLYILKIVISAAAFTLITELARRNNALAALFTALPVTTVLVLLWRYHQEHASSSELASYLTATFWYVLPSLAFFLTMPWLLHRGWTFYPAFLVAVVGTVVLYLALIRALPIFGLKL